MRKFLTALFLITILCLPSFAEDDLSTGIDGLKDFEHSFEGQKQITDQEFNKVLEQVESKQKKNKKKKKKIFKGEDLNQQDEFQHIQGLGTEPNLLQLPINIILNTGVKIPSGHYKIIGKKTRQETTLEFHQGHLLVATVPVIEVQNDFDEKTINFIKIIPYDDQFIKIIYGCVDFNAYAFLPIQQETNEEF